MERGAKHFQGKEALSHVVEAQARGLIASAEAHGMEIPGHWSAGSDAARETAVVSLLLSGLVQSAGWWICFVFLAGFLIWKWGRSAWLGWSRLERLHRIMTQEKWEIEHHREQEREELRELYRAKGFEGKLLEEVLDVLMADGDRLLRVMLEEELGLSLKVHEHPLKQGLGAGVGVLLAGCFCLGGMILPQPMGILAAAGLVIALSTYFSARFQQNRPIPAIIWNLGIALLAFAMIYFIPSIAHP